MQPAQEGEAKARVTEQTKARGTDSSSELKPASTQEEDRRDRRIWWMLFAVGFVVFIGIILLGRPLVAGRLAAARNLDRATTMIAGTQGEFAAIDAAVRGPSVSDSAAVDGEALAAISATRQTLAEASRLSQMGNDRLTEDEQKRARLVGAMAIARIEVLDAAEVFLSARGQAGSESKSEQGLTDYGAAVDKMQQADAALVKL